MVFESLREKRCAALFAFLPCAATVRRLLIAHRSFCLLQRWHHAKLLHQSQRIPHHPTLRNPSTGDAVDDDAFNPERFVGRSNPAQLSLVRACRRVPSSHEVICINHVVNLEFGGRDSSFPVFGSSTCSSVMCSISLTLSRKMTSAPFKASL